MCGGIKYPTNSVQFIVVFKHCPIVINMHCTKDVITDLVPRYNCFLACSAGNNVPVARERGPRHLWGPWQWPNFFGNFSKRIYDGY